jgi:hypothetical protein
MNSQFFFNNLNSPLIARALNTFAGNQQPPAAAAYAIRHRCCERHRLACLWQAQGALFACLRRKRRCAVQDASTPCRLNDRPTIIGAEGSQRGITQSLGDNSADALDPELLAIAM